MIAFNGYSLVAFSVNVLYNNPIKTIAYEEIFMSTQESASKNSKTGMTVIILVTALIFGLMIYVIEFAPAKSWNVKNLAECSLSLNDRKKASDLLDQVSDTPRSGKIDRLIAECRQLREDEKIKEANALMAEAKAKIKTLEQQEKATLITN